MTWEPKEHCNCLDLIKKFEKKLKDERKSSVKPSSVKEENENQKSDSDSDDELVDSKTVFTKDYITNLLKKNLKPEKVIGITDEPGELTFLIKWKNQSEPDLVPARVANKHYSKYVIKFYEGHLVFNNK